MNSRAGFISYSLKRAYAAGLAPAPAPGSASGTLAPPRWLVNATIHISKHFGLIPDMITRISPSLISYQNGRKACIIIAGDNRESTNEYVTARIDMRADEMLIST
jgi:hypothetical protein